MRETDGSATPHSFAEKTLVSVARERLVDNTVVTCRTLRCSGNVLAVRTTDGLKFPNPSREYELRADGVRYWAYDDVVEVTFIIYRDALAKVANVELSAGDDCLAAFDKNIVRIHQLSRARYSQRSERDHLFSYTLTASFV